jgi:hypothetical protein
MEATRIYVVTRNEIQPGGNERLVEATSQAQALRFVAEKAYTVEVAKPKVVGQMMGNGVKIEDAASQK